MYFSQTRVVTREFSKNHGDIFWPAPCEHLRMKGRGMDRTPWNPDWSLAISRVSSLVEGLFSCRVKFQTIEAFLERGKAATDADGVTTALYLEQDLVFLESSLFEPPALIRGLRPGAFAFPLRVRRAGAPKSDVSLVGIATIEGLAASDDARLQQLGEFLQMAVESRIEAFERLLDVERQERMVLEQAEVREPSKVIRLFPRSTEPSVESFRLRSYEDGLNLPKPILLTGLPIMTTTSRTFPFSRIALEIFNRTSLWFFVTITDLSDDAFQSAQSLRDLGRMCIFIPNLAALPIERQLRLAEVFGSEESNTDTPRFIAVLHETPASAIANGTVLPHLLDLLMTVSLDSVPVAMSHASEPTAKMVRSIVQTIEARIKGEAAPTFETKGSNLIPLLGRWQHDDGSNPTFH